MPEVRDADAVTAADAAAVAVDEVAGGVLFFEDLDLDGSFTDFEAMSRDGIRLPPLVLLPAASAVDAFDPSLLSSSPADLAFFCCS